MHAAVKPTNIVELDSGANVLPLSSSFAITELLSLLGRTERLHLPRHKTEFGKLLAGIT